MSDPPGARVQLEGEGIGETPVSVDFTHYGTREITLMKEGFETATVMQEIPPPWYQRPPLDFFSDNFLPAPIWDRRRFFYRLEPKQFVSQDELQQRADSVRLDALGGL